MEIKYIIIQGRYLISVFIYVLHIVYKLLVKLSTVNAFAITSDISSQKA